MLVWGFSKSTVFLREKKRNLYNGFVSKKDIDFNFISKYLIIPDECLSQSERYKVLINIVLKINS